MLPIPYSITVPWLDSCCNEQSKYPVRQRVSPAITPPRASGPRTCECDGSSTTQISADLLFSHLPTRPQYVLLLLTKNLKYRLHHNTRLSLSKQTLNFIHHRNVKMAAKHFINDPTYLVDTALHSLTLTNPSVALDVENRIVYVRPLDESSQVSIISGGGSGHEPSFGAFVGQGLLAASVAGTIFASPSAEQIRKAVQSRVDTNNGVLVVVMNYTGDVLNFGMAVEKARASGIEAEMVVVGDDVGVGRKQAGKVGRRGIAGTVLVLKISGALAAQGASLKDVTNLAKLTAENIVSVGASLDHVHVPGRAPPDPNSDGVLGVKEVEIGMGIHNEAGSGRAKVELPELVKTMLQQMLDVSDKDRHFLNVNSNEVVLLVNNLGGVSVLELGGITAEVVSQLDKSYSIKPIRILAGTYMTSLNGLGFSISLLNVVNTNLGGPSMLQLLDAPCEATGWAAPIRKETWEAKSSHIRDDRTSSAEEVKPSGLKLDPTITETSLKSALERVVAAEPDVTLYDTVVGDGDCGIGLKRGAESVLKMLSSSKLSGDAVIDVNKIVSVVENTMDGTSGALYAIFLNALVHGLRQESSAGSATPKVWGKALRSASKALSKYTPAAPGDRTLVDALHPFVETLVSTGSLTQAAEASRKGAENTKGMKASLGRTVYIGGTGFEHVPDPGAWGLSEFFMGLARIEPSGSEKKEAIERDSTDAVKAASVAPDPMPLLEETGKVKKKPVAIANTSASEPGMSGTNAGTGKNVDDDYEMV